MNGTIATLVVEIVGDISKYSTSLRDAREQAGSFTSSAVSGLSALGGTVVMGALAVGTAGIVALSGGIYQSIQAATEAQQIQAQLGAVIKSTGGIAGVTGEMVNGLANQLSMLTPYEDETIVKAESMLLTFTNIGKDIFPDATKAILDMSTALGQDWKSSAIQLGKALQDPIEGVTALRRVGVQFTEEQQDMIKGMVEAGDLMGAQKFILTELQREFGGSAEAAGKTFAGSLEILHTIIGNMGETIGNAFLPMLTELATTLNEYLSKPETLAFIQGLADGIADLARTAVTHLPDVIMWIRQAFGWLEDHRGVIVAAIAVIGAAIVAWAVTTAIAIAPIVIELLPVIAIIALIAIMAYLLYTAWTQNWGGIQQKTAEAITAIRGFLMRGVGYWNWFWNEINLIIAYFQPVIDAVFQNLGLLAEAFGLLLAGDSRRAGELVRQVWDNAWKGIKILFLAGILQIELWYRDFLTWLWTQATTIDWAAVGRDIITGIVEGLLSMALYFAQSFLGVILGSFDFARGFLGNTGSLNSFNRNIPGISGAAVPAINSMNVPTGLQGINSINKGMTINIEMNSVVASDSPYEIAQKLGPAIQLKLQQMGITQ